MNNNPLKKLETLGQSVWLDYIRKDMFASGAGIESRINQGKPVKNVASVASFFLSRIDSVIDPVEQSFAASVGEQEHFSTSKKLETDGIEKFIKGH